MERVVEVENCDDDDGGGGSVGVGVDKTKQSIQLLSFVTRSCRQCQFHVRSLGFLLVPAHTWNVTFYVPKNFAAVLSWIAQ